MKKMFLLLMTIGLLFSTSVFEGDDRSIHERKVVGGTLHHYTLVHKVLKDCYVLNPVRFFRIISSRSIDTTIDPTKPRNEKFLEDVWKLVSISRNND